jgi:hypothetical protein
MSYLQVELKRWVSDIFNYCQFIKRGILPCTEKCWSKGIYILPCPSYDLPGSYLPTTRGMQNYFKHLELLISEIWNSNSGLCLGRSLCSLPLLPILICEGGNYRQIEKILETLNWKNLRIIRCEQHNEIKLIPRFWAWTTEWMLVSLNKIIKDEERKQKT